MVLRATMDPVRGGGTKADIADSDGAFTWSDGDQIAVHSDEGYVNFVLESGAGTGQGTFVQEFDGTRDFYAVYPASYADDSNYGSSTLSVVLPASYTIDNTREDWKAYYTTYSPLPMVAVNDAAQNTLSFKHVGGVFRITLDDIPAGTSSITVTFDKDVTGGFAVNVTDPAAPVIETTGATTLNTVTFYFKAALSEELDGLVLNVPVPTGNYTGKIKLATGNYGANIENTRTVSRTEGWKLSDALRLETFTYTLLATSTPSSLVQAGTAQEYSVTSYKTSDLTGEVTIVPWTAEFSTDDGSTWSSSAPYWLTTFTSGGDGSATAVSYSVGASKNDSASAWEGENAVVAASQGAARDLSCYDIYGTYTGGTERSTPYNTANCYVISAPGWYCFPCVYGNAIKEGSDNTGAYRKGVADATNSMGAFKNHTGNGITAPWIKDNAVAIDHFELLWQDVYGMICDVSLSSDYIYFYVNPQRIGQGNAVIAAKLSDETIVWSWHIWVMDKPSEKLATKPVYSSQQNAALNPNNMMLVNLGFVDCTIPVRNVQVRFGQASSTETAIITISQEGGEEFNNPFYQWGRKDPMYPSNGVDDVIKTIYDGAGAIVSLPADVGNADIAAGIKNPTAVCDACNISPSNWCSTRYDNLWNAPSSIDRDDPVTKTIYDPCPVGFSVPNRSAFTGFNTNASDNHFSERGNGNVSASNSTSMGDSRGYHFYLDRANHELGTIFFPAMGTRTRTADRAAGYIDVNGNVSGGYFTAAAYNDSQYCNARLLSFAANKIWCLNRWAARVGSQCIRPAKEYSN